MVHSGGIDPDSTNAKTSTDADSSTWPTLHPPYHFPTDPTDSPAQEIKLHPSVLPYAIPLSELLLRLPEIPPLLIPPSPQPTSSPSSPLTSTPSFPSSHPLDRLSVSAFIFHTPSPSTTPNPTPHLLLLLRAPHDLSFPSLWEPPGGGSSPAHDASILHTCAREVFEETGLRVTGVLGVVRWGRMVGQKMREVVGQDGRMEWRRTVWGRVGVVVEVDGVGDGEFPRVKVDPNEHVEYRWASREDIQRITRRQGEGGKGFTSPEVEGWVARAFEVWEEEMSGRVGMWRKG